MSNADLENALLHLAVLRELLSYADVPGKNADVLAALELLAGSMSRSLTDSGCQRRIGELRGFARSLYSGEEPRRWRQPPLNGRDHLRLQILKSLNALGARIRLLSGSRAQCAANDAIVPVRWNRS